jgi:hypothetical protein
VKEPWASLITEEQRRLLNSACGDLARDLLWHGQKLSKDDYRHLLSGTAKGWRMVPGINGGFVMLGASSLSLSKEEATEALTMAFELGDQPWTYCKDQTRAVRWNPTVRIARGIPDDE